MASSVAVLTNPAAGKGRGDADQVTARIRAAGHDPQRIDTTSAQASLAAVHEAVAAGLDRLVVVGGDGLVNLAVQAVATTPTVLGIVAEGTGNDFARAIGLPIDEVDEATDRALDDPSPVDAMRTTHGWVASVATLGFSGDVTDRANNLRWPRGSQRYTVATILQLPRLRRISATLTVDGERHDADTTMLSVGNTAYFGGGMKICPGTTHDDGLLEVVVIGPVGKATFLRVFPRVFGGSHVDHPDVTVFRGREIRIEGSPDVDLWADGEHMGPLPVECSIVSGALQVAGVPVRR